LVLAVSPVILHEKSPTESVYLSECEPLYTGEGEVLQQIPTANIFDVPSNTTVPMPVANTSPTLVMAFVVTVGWPSCSLFFLHPENKIANNRQKPAINVMCFFKVFIWFVLIVQKFKGSKVQGSGVQRFRVRI
jgi:hypothetical protein